jgi:CelD/BcsL family acetyltransferase involved in cellulose biosynthesis
MLGILRTARAEKDCLKMAMALTETAGRAAAPARFVATRLGDLDDPFVTRAAAWATSPFHSLPFLRTLAETLCAAKGVELVLIAVEDAEGAPRALFPFTLGREGGRRVIEGLGLGVADYYIPLTAPGFIPDAAEAKRLWRAVRSALPRADVLRLRNVPRLPLGEPHALSSAAFLTPMGHTSTTIIARNAQGDAIYDIKKLSANRALRKALRRGERWFGPITFAAAETPARIEDALEIMIAQRLQRFASLNRPDILRDPAFVAFYRELALPAVGEPLARLYCLKASDEIVAVIEGLAFAGTFTPLVSSISPDPKYNRLSPGFTAAYFAVEDNLERGCRAYDLSVGELSYKARFHGQTAELFERREALSPRGLPAVLAGRRRTRARRLRRAHPALFAWLRRESRPDEPSDD